MTPIHVSLLHHAIMAGRTNYLTQVIFDVCRRASKYDVIDFIEDGLRTPAIIQYRAAEALISSIWDRLPRRQG